MKQLYLPFRGGFWGAICSLLLLIGCSNGDSVVTSPDTGAQPAPSTTIVLPVSSPMRIADFDPDTLLVSDARSNAVHFIDKATLEVDRSIKIAGRPTGVAHLGGLLFVGNKTTGSVEALNLNGELQFYLGKEGDFPQVNDLAVDEAAGTVYVLDTQLGAIKAFKATDGLPTGLVISGLPLVRPTALTVDASDGRLLVSDYGPDPRILFFDSSGAELDTAHISGTTAGFSMPQGLCIDAAGNLFLAEARLGEVLVVDASNNLVTTIGSRGIGEGELLYPLDVFVDPLTRDLFVTDNQNGRISAFVGGGVVP